MGVVLLFKVPGSSRVPCGGQPSPHKPRLVVSHSKCPPLSSSPRAQLCIRYCSNKRPAYASGYEKVRKTSKKGERTGEKQPFHCLHVAALRALWEYEPWGKNNPLVAQLSCPVSDSSEPETPHQSLRCPIVLPSLRLLEEPVRRRRPRPADLF